jgi:hypothetical protein
LPPSFDETIGNGFCSVIKKHMEPLINNIDNEIIIIVINNGVYLTFKNSTRRFNL